VTRIGQQLLVFVLGFAAACPISAQSIQDLTAVTKAAQDYIAAAAQQATPGEAEVTVGRLDERLQLPACAATLQLFLPPGARTMGDTTVGVRCDEPKPWTLYVPVRVSVYAQVLVATRPLQRGALLQADDLKLERRELGTLYGGYLSQTEQALGMVIRRSLMPGAVVEPSAVEARTLVQRGQSVVLVSRGAGIEVRAAGEALASGALGAWVQVRNLSSKRIVEGTVIEGGIVEVPL
jgi:flagella basal body P-ring formation protein FlgA